METALAPFFATADTLMPQWHVSICGSDIEDQQQETHPPMCFSLRGESDGLEATRRQQLHDTLSAFALAFEINARAFVAAVCAYKQKGLADCRSLDERTPRLRLKVAAAVGFKSDGDAVGELTAFFTEWSDQNTSDELQRCVELLTARSIHAPGVPRFDLTLQLDVLRLETYHSRVHSLVKMVQSINREVFAIATVSLSISNTDFADMVWEELLHLLHSLHRDSDIHVQVELPSACGIGFPPLIPWKRRLDLLTKSPHVSMTDAQSTTVKEWNVVLQYRHPEYSTSAAARVVISSLTALAHSSINISSLRIAHPLRAGSSGVRYGKWIGYLLRANVVEKLHWSERVTPQDVGDIESIMLAPTQVELLQRLWLSSWRDDGLAKFASVRQAVADESHFVGVMHDDEGDDCVDVLLVGLGQCRVDRRLVSAAIDKLERRASTMQADPRATPLKELTLTLDRGSDIVCAVRLVSRIGSSLEELVFSGDRIGLTSLVAILEACPNLLRLSIKNLNLHDNVGQLTPHRGKVYPLESLSVDATLDDAASGLLGLVPFITQQTPHLKEFHLCVSMNPRAAINQDNASRIARVLSDGLPFVTSFHVSGLQSGYFDSMFTRETAPIQRPIDTLRLDGVAFTDVTWKALMDALSSDQHPLAISLRSLALGVNDTDGHKGHDVALMLERNRTLVDVRVEFRGRGVTASFPISTPPTHGASTGIRIGPLPIHHKLAWLSIVESMEWPQNPDVSSCIFAFAALTSTRRVRFTCTA